MNSGTSQEAAVRAAVEHYVAMLRRRPGGRVDAILTEGAEVGRSFGLCPGEDPTADLYDDDDRRDDHRHLGDPD